jgi:hypothetical protein
MIIKIHFIKNIILSSKYYHIAQNFFFRENRILFFLGCQRIKCVQKLTKTQIFFINDLKCFHNHNLSVEDVINYLKT